MLKNVNVDHFFQNTEIFTKEPHSVTKLEKCDVLPRPNRLYSNIHLVNKHIRHGDVALKGKFELQKVVIYNYVGLNILLADLAAAPIRTAGIANTTHPKAATNDKI